MRYYSARRRMNILMVGLSIAATVFGLGWLSIILFTLIVKGVAGSTSPCSLR